MSRLIAILLFAALIPCALAQPSGEEWEDWEDWGEWDDWSDFESFLDNQEDPSDYDNDFDTDFEPDEVVALNISRAGLAQARSLGFRLQERRYLRTLGFTLARLRPPGHMNLRAALARLRQVDPDGFYDRNTLYQLASGKTSCAGTRCYGQTLIGWNSGCHVAVRIGMVDSALDLSNPALAGRRIQYQRIHPSSPAAKESEHGTAVAALLVGAADSAFPGLLPDAELIAADVFWRGRDGDLLTDAARFAIGLDWVAGQQPTVINISIAGPDGGVLRTAIKRLLQAGIPIVAAAGNLGPKAPAQYPAAYPGVVAVTAVDRELRVYAKANQGAYVTLAAPGVGIWTSGEKGAGVFREGTSFAAPFATASLALLKSRQPKLAPAAMVKQLKNTARDLGPPGNDATFGWGLVRTKTCSG